MCTRARVAGGVARLWPAEATVELVPQPQRPIVHDRHGRRHAALATLLLATPTLQIQAAAAAAAATAAAAAVAAAALVGPIVALVNFERTLLLLRTRRPSAVAACLGLLATHRLAAALLNLLPDLSRRWRVLELVGSEGVEQRVPLDYGGGVGWGRELDY